MRATCPRTFLLVLVVFLAGCAGSHGRAATSSSTRPIKPPSATDLRGRKLVLTNAVVGGRRANIAVGRSPTIVLGRDGTLVADDGCNTTDGRAEVVSGRLNAQSGTRTDMACFGNPISSQQVWFNSVVFGRPVVTTTDGQLVLVQGADRLTFGG